MSQKIKIEFEIPEWAIGKNISIFAGKELLAHTSFIREKTRNDQGILTIKEFYPPLKLKEGRCNGCGQCCETAGSPFTKEQYYDLYFRLDNNDWQETGRCPLLGENGCSLDRNMPFECARSDCSKHFDKCTESFIDVNDIQVIV